MLRAVVGLAMFTTFSCLALGVYGRFFTPPPPQPSVEDKFDSVTPLSTTDEFEHLAKTDPLAMYQQCLAHYQRTATGFTATLVKRERVEGKPTPPAEPQEEVIDLAVRGDTPDPVTGKHCIEVSMWWVSGARKLPIGPPVRGTLYSEKPGSEGTGGKIVSFRPGAILGEITRVNPTDPIAIGQSRYCIRDAGVYRGMLRTRDAWKDRQEARTLRTEYIGKRPVPECDGRVCYIIDRHCASVEVDPFELGGPPVTNPAILERDGFTRVRIMIDAETWLQVGTELYRPDGQLLASYFFRKVNTNPTFADSQFTLAGLKAKK